MHALDRVNTGPGASNNPRHQMAKTSSSAYLNSFVVSEQSIYHTEQISSKY